MHLIGARQIVIGRRDDRAMGVLQPFKTGLKTFHRHTAKVDNIGAQTFLVRRDQRPHQIVIL